MLKLAVSDVFDYSGDSWALIQGGSLTCSTNGSSGTSTTFGTQRPIKMLVY